MLDYAAISCCTTACMDCTALWLSSAHCARRCKEVPGSASGLLQSLCRVCSWMAVFSLPCACHTLLAVSRARRRKSLQARNAFRGSSPGVGRS